jgi:urease accessory protein UreF
MSGHLQPGCEDELWLALQICDSFPGGAFAHSLGLESALQHKFVNGGTGTLDLFVSLALEQACAQLIPLVSSAHESYFRISRIEKICPELSLKDLIRVDNLCHITLTNEVARRSSINQGTKLGSKSQEIGSNKNSRSNDSYVVLI